MLFLRNNFVAHISKSVGIVGICVLLYGCASLKAKGYSSLGGHYFGEKDFQKSAEYMEKAIEKDPSNTGHLTMLGWSYFKGGDYDKAISTFEELALLDADALDAYTGRGWSYFKKLDFDRAITYFKEAVDIDSNVADAFEGLGWCNFRKGNVEAAQKYFEIALKKGMRYKDGTHTKTSPEAHRGLGYLNFSKSDFKEALKHFKIATRVMPDWNDARVKWADCLFSLERYKEALGIYKHALKYGKSAEIYDKIGWSYFYLENKKMIFGVEYRRYKAARKMFNNALVIDPNYASSLTGLAKIDAEMDIN